MSDFVTDLVARPAVGAVVEASGGLVRVHYGTHATVDHGRLPDGDLELLVRREQERFAERREPVEWRVPGDAPAGLPEVLRRAGFAAGWSRALVVAAVLDLPRAGAGTASGGVTRSGRVRPLVGTDYGWLLDAAAGTGPHRRSFAEASADGPVAGFVAEVDGRPAAALWGHLVEGTGVAAVDGLTAVRRSLLAAWREWCLFRRVSHVVAEADGARLAALLQAGLRQLGTYTSFHWSPADAVA